MTASKTTKKSLEVPGICFGASYDVEDRPTVLGGAGVVGDESGTEVLSTSTTRIGCSPLGRSSAKSPPVGVEEMRVA